MTTVTPTRLSSTGINIPQAKRESLVSLLNQTLANLFDLKSQVKQAHWNVKGPQFFQLHELFDMLAGELEPMIDDIAERAITLGGFAQGTARMAVSASMLQDSSISTGEGIQLVRELSHQYATVANQVREAIDSADGLGDADTADLFTEVSRNLDKRLWFLEAHLQNN